MVGCSISSDVPFASVPVGTTLGCSAYVSGQVPTGTITWATNGAGILSPTSCTLEPVDVFGECGVQYTPTAYAPSEVNITATYSGDSYNAGSSGTFTLTVAPATESTTSESSVLALGTQTVTTVEYHTVTLEVQQIDAFTLSFAVVIAGALIAIGIVLSARMQRKTA